MFTFMVLTKRHYLGIISFLTKTSLNQLFKYFLIHSFSCYQSFSLHFVGMVHFLVNYCFKESISGIVQIWCQESIAYACEKESLLTTHY